MSQYSLAYLLVYVALNVSMEIDKQPVVQSYEELVQSYVVSVTCKECIKLIICMSTWHPCDLLESERCTVCLYLLHLNPHNVIMVSNSVRCVSIQIVHVYVHMCMTVGAGSQAGPGACTGNRAVTSCARVG